MTLTRPQKDWRKRPRKKTPLEGAEEGFETDVTTSASVVIELPTDRPLVVDEDVEAHIAGILPLPTAAAAAAEAGGPFRTPGAYADGTTLLSIPTYSHLGASVDADRHSIGMTPTTMETFTTMTATTAPRSDALAEAQPVDEEGEEERRLSLPRATEPKTAGSVKSWVSTRMLIALASLAVFVAVVATIIVVTTRENTINTNVLHPDGPDSQQGQRTDAPTTLDLDLPPTSWAAIQKNDQSPQAKAYRWMQNDPHFDTYSMTRKLQRFALATLHLSTTSEELARNGTNHNQEDHDLPWTDAHGWMSYDIHECEWFA